MFVNKDREMNVKIKIRPLNNFGPADCRCCDKLDWRYNRLDRQILKEAVNDAEYTVDERKGIKALP